jgi:hypothetical protein
LIKIIEHPGNKQESRKAKQNIFENTGIVEGIKIFNAEARNQKIHGGTKKCQKGRLIGQSGAL